MVRQATGWPTLIAFLAEVANLQALAPQPSIRSSIIVPGIRGRSTACSIGAGEKPLEHPPVLPLLLEG
jgi:hypothetical protein